MNLKDFDKEVTNSQKLTLVDLWAPWCGPCLAMNPVLGQLGGIFPDNLKIVKVNVDESPEVVGKLGVRSIPTIVFYKNGVVVQTLNGAKNLKFMTETIEGLLK